MIIITFIIGVIAIPFVMAMFLSKAYTISDGTTINKPSDEVFKYIRLLKNQDYYSKWVMTDPAMRKKFMGIDGTPGFIYAWDSDNKQAGKGEQEIKRIVEGSTVDIEVRFEKPFKGVAQTSLVITPLSNNTSNVKWSLSGPRNYPLRVMHVLLNMKNILGKDIALSLSNLKIILEK